MIDTVLCVDIGTTSLKTAVVSANGEVVFISNRHFSIFSDCFIALSWKEHLKSAINELNSAVDFSLYRICAVSISGNGPTVVLESGLTFKWNDDVSFLYEKFPLLIEEKSLFLPRILGMLFKYPQESSSTSWIFSGPEFLIYELTGCPVTVLPQKRFVSAYWDSCLLEKYNIDKNKMPPFTGIAQICGYLSPSAAEELGLPEGIPVTSGGPDFVAALIGTKTLQNGMICDRCGSSEGFNFATKTFISHKDVRTLPSVIEDLWNVSVLIPESAKLSEYERIVHAQNAVNLLKKLAEENGVIFPEKMTATGGQAKNLALLKKKSDATGMQIAVCQCADGEVLGDACAGFVALKKYSSLVEAANHLVKETIL